MVVSSRLKLATELKVSPSMVDRYIASGMPTLKVGYDVGACQAWLDKYRASSGRPTKADPADGDLREQKLKAEIRKINADGEAKELKNQIANGSVYMSDEADQYLAANATLVRQRLELLPDEIVLGFAPDHRDDARETARRYIHDLLIELSRPFRGPNDENDNAS